MSSSASISLHETLRHPKAPASTRSRVKTMLSTGVEVRRIAVETGAKLGDIKAWLEGKSDDAAVENRLAVWIEELDQAAAEDDQLPWAETPTTLRIESVIEQARRVPTIGLIYGGAGLGKTVTARRFAQRHEKVAARAYYVAANAFTSTPSTFMFSLAEAVLGLSVNIERARGYAAYAVVGKILNALRPGDLICVDEAQHLEPTALDAIRVFHDKAGCGICLLGNELVFTRIGGKGRRAEFAQIHSRVGARLHIAAPGQDDIDAILLAWGVKGSAERQFLHQIGSGAGGLRQLANVVRHSKIVARQMGRPLDVQILRAAASGLGIDD